MCAYACVVSSLCPVYFSSTGHTAPPVHKTGHPVSTDTYRPGVSRPVKSCPLFRTSASGVRVLFAIPCRPFGSHWGFWVPVLKCVYALVVIECRCFSGTTFSSASALTLKTTSKISAEMLRHTLPRYVPYCGVIFCWRFGQIYDRTIISIGQKCRAVLFNLIIRMEPLGAFRLVTEPHAVTQGFVLLQVDRSIIFLYLVIHKNTSWYRFIYVCNTLIVD